VTFGGNILTIFFIINLPNFVHLLTDAGFSPPPPPLNFYEASRFVPPIGRTSLTDTTDKQTDGKETNGRIFLSVYVLECSSALTCDAWRRMSSVQMSLFAGERRLYALHLLPVSSRVLQWLSGGFQARKGKKTITCLMIVFMITITIT